MGSTNLSGNQRAQLPEVSPVLAHDIDKHEVLPTQRLRPFVI